MQESVRPSAPQRVGAYRLLELLGEGGQGTVYRGEAANGEQVAVKLLHARFSGDAKARARFAGELAHARRVAPFCTARVLDAEVEGDQPYIVSELINGPSLSALVAAGKVPDGPGLQRLAIATVTALVAIHEAGVVHRDFKPSNVIMGTDGARVIDFGIARALDATGTLSSAVVGTPAYMAPEQISGATVGPAADVFAWGCTIAYASNNVTPFGQDSIPAVMHRILHEEPDLREMSAPLRDVVGACLAKEPAERPTARQILLRLLGAEESSTTPETLLTQGARASAFPPPAAPAQQDTLPAGPGPYAPGPYGSAPVAHAPVPWGPPPPGSAHSPGVRAGSRTARLAISVAVTIAAVVLGASTLLPWAKVMVLDGVGTSRIPMDSATVTGAGTIWGICTLLVAVIAITIAITDMFTQRLFTAWAAIPGGAAIALIVGFLIRRADLHSKLTFYPKMSEADFRSAGQILSISIAPGWYVAPFAALALMVLALVSLAIRRPEQRP